MSKHSRGASRLVQWSADTTWKRLKRDLEMFPDGLKVLELCGGVGTAHVALQELLKDVATFSIVDHFDVDEALEPLLIASGLSSQNMHLGRHEGDILKQSPRDFPVHHLLVAGPPCPPWSSIGCRSSWADARSKPFYKVIDIISYHAQHGALLFFVLENVVGVLSQTKNCKEKPIDVIVNRLRNACPGWSIEVHKVNSLDFGLPQYRPRVYIVGRKHSPEDSESPMPALRTFRTRLPLSQCLEKSDNTPSTYTELQKRNIKEWKELYKFELQAAKFANQFAIVDASRTPTRRTSWCNAKKQPDRCPCLTASGSKLHVFALGPNAGSRSLSLDRPLRNTERARIQGFHGAVVEAASHMSSAAGKKAFGNAMSVPVVGSFIARELIGLRRAMGIENLTALFSRQQALTEHYQPGNSHHAGVVPCADSITRDPSSREDVLASEHKVISTRLDGTSAKRRCLRHD